jgi:murein DD-endopeptidase MepM/ murein hydrolase activator NlpD
MSIRKLLGAVGLVVVVALATAVWNLSRERPALPLRMPVAGLAPSQVHSSFGAPRSGGRRRHHGVDLFAPRGAPVRAATSGVVLFVGTNELGGRIVYMLGEGLLTYFAHLDDWAPGLHAGQRVRRGTLLGYVGDSGNARGTPCHLHFAAHPIWKWGRPVDPAPLLVAEVRREPGPVPRGGCASDTNRR